MNLDVQARTVTTLGQVAEACKAMGRYCTAGMQFLNLDSARIAHSRTQLCVMDTGALVFKVPLPVISHHLRHKLMRCSIVSESNIMSEANRLSGIVQTYFDKHVVEIAENLRGIAELAKEFSQLPILVWDPSSESGVETSAFVIERPAMWSSQSDLSPPTLVVAIPDNFPSHFLTLA